MTSGQRGRPCKSHRILPLGGGTNEAEVVRTISWRSMAELRENRRPLHHEDPGELPDKSSWLTTKAMPEGARRAAGPDERMQERLEPCAGQAERPVVRQCRIGQPGNVGQANPREPGVRLVGSASVHERQRRSGRVDGRAQGGNVGQRLATERSTEMAEEDHQGRPIAGQRLEPRAARIRDYSHQTKGS